jgi:8-oxo-dGTP pyrophosphatase MutT (NUDIX family)
MANEQEVVDIITEDGTVLRQVLKTEAHRHGWLHKTVIGCLKYSDGWALVRQADDRQDAGQLVNPVGGHVAAGEATEEALLRECEEEIGTRNVTYRHKGSIVFHRQVIGRDENHLFEVYEIETDDPIILNAEAVAIERFTHADLKRLLEEQPEKFGDAYYFVLEAYYPEYLPDGYTRRWVAQTGGLL